MNIHTQYLDRNVSGILAGILHDRAYDRIPILMDALQDAGADEATMRDALYWWVLAEPGRDEPRLRWAEVVGRERGEFVRVQVELSRPCANTVCAAMRTQHEDAGCSACHPLRRRERELFTHDAVFDWFPVPTDRMGATCRRKRNEIAFVQFESSRRINRDRTEPATEQTYYIARGFIDNITLSWADWLRHHAAIYYYPNQRVTCPKCEGVSSLGGGCQTCSGTGTVPRPFTREVACPKCANGYAGWGQDASGRALQADKNCEGCSGSGRITQSLAGTAQPITKVRLTTWPPARDFPAQQATQTFYAHDDADHLYRFDRAKCGMCNGTGKDERINTHPSYLRQYEKCRKCHDGYGNPKPLNEWKCEDWPSITFAMPEDGSRESLHGG